MPVEILRLGHRKKRDIRVTTHCCLSARALGAKKIIISGEKDGKVERSLAGVNERFGLGTTLEWTENALKTLKQKKKKGYKAVHLTMYGLPIQNQVRKIRKHNKIITVVGAEKVPREFYEEADYNISVSNQPHSEIASLAVFLDRYFAGKELEKKFSKAKKRIIPRENGKQVKNCSI